MDRIDHIRQETIEIVFDSRTMNLRISRLMGSYGITVKISRRKLRKKLIAHQVLYHREKGGEIK